MILFEVKITRKPTIIFILLSIFISLGCTQRVQLYDGPPRYGKVATLFEIPIDTNLEVDGKPVKWDKTDKAVRADGSMVPYGFVHVELLPGRHTIEWSRDRHDVNFTFEGLGILNAKAGKYYKMRFATLKGKQIKMWSPNSFNTIKYAVHDHATWIEQIDPWKKIIAAGTKPKWTESHDCEICRVNKAAPYEYGCQSCSRK